MCIKECTYCDEHQVLYVSVESLNYIPETNIMIYVNYLAFFFTFIYFGETEWDKVWAGEGQSEKETQNLKQAPGSGASSIEPDTGLKLTDCEIMTWAEVRCSTDWATQVPLSGIV